MTDRQNFRRISGPDETTIQPDAVFELSNLYEGEPTPSGRIPYVEVTYYVTAYEGDEFPGDEEQDRWGIDACWHHYCLDPASVYPDDPDPSDDDYDYEGGSDLWYWSEQSAINACRNAFAVHDEAWKLNDWTPA